MSSEMRKSAAYNQWLMAGTEVRAWSCTWASSMGRMMDAVLIYEAFNKTQKITSDFDKAVSRMLKAGEQHE